MEWGLRVRISRKKERRKLLVGWSLVSYSHMHTRWWCQLRKHDSAIVEAKSIGLKSPPFHRSAGCRPGRPAEIILCPGQLMEGLEASGGGVCPGSHSKLGAASALWMLVIPCSNTCSKFGVGNIFLEMLNWYSFFKNYIFENRPCYIILSCKIKFVTYLDKNFWRLCHVVSLAQYLFNKLGLEKPASYSLLMFVKLNARHTKFLTLRYNFRVSFSRVLFGLIL